MKYQIVVDLGFGDSGKGVVVSNLCEQSSRPLVVRYTGGPQAGHNVSLEDREISHTFSSFGSGTLQGAPSYFGPKTLCYVPNLSREYKLLQETTGMDPELYLDPASSMITPMDVAYGRMRERMRTGHGSCGLGIGATMTRQENSPYKLFTADLVHKRILEEKLRGIQVYYAELLKGASEREVYYYEEELAAHMADWNEVKEETGKDLEGVVISSFPEAVGKTRPSDIIFEGAQGIGLDMDHGVFPNVTYGHTTSRNAWEIGGLSMGVSEVEMFFVTRCYLTRHGAGWMSKEWMHIEDVNNNLMNLHTEVNTHNEWQKGFRIGPFDYELINHSFAVDRIYQPEDLDIKRNLVFTCVDQMLDGWFPDLDKIQPMESSIDQVYTNNSPYTGYMKKLDSQELFEI